MAARASESHPPGQLDDSRGTLLGSILPDPPAAVKQKLGISQELRANTGFDGGLSSEQCGHRAGSRSFADRRLPNHERQPSAGRGTVNRAPCCGNHALFGDHATQDQERRVSARRGC
jgi:hypothetical protein